MRILHISQKPNDIRAQRAAFSTPEHEHALLLGTEYTRSDGLDAITPPTDWGPGIPMAKVYASAKRSEVQAAILEMKPGLIHVHEPMTLRMVPVPDSVPVIVDHHEWELDRSIQWDSPRLRNIRRQLVDSALDRTRHHIVPSSGLANELIRYCGGLAITTIYNAPPMLPDGYRPRPELAREVLKDFIQPDDRFVVFAGNMTPDRRIDLLLNTILHLQRQDPRWRLLALSPPSTVPTDVRHRLEATAMLCLEPCAYPWPWSLDRINMLDVLSLGTVGWSFAEVGFTSWRHSAPNKAFEYLAAGLPQVCDRGTWMESNIPGAIALDDDPALAAEAIVREHERGDESHNVFDIGHHSLRRFACNGEQQRGALLDAYSYAVGA